jgi:hypothetical protein
MLNGVGNPLHGVGNPLNGVGHTALIDRHSQTGHSSTNDAQHDHHETKYLQISVFTNLHETKTSFSLCQSIAILVAKVQNKTDLSTKET